MTEKTIEGYAESLKDWRGEEVVELAGIVRQAVPGAEEGIKWSQPVFSRNGLFCYIKAAKNTADIDASSLTPPVRQSAEANNKYGNPTTVKA